MSTNESDELLWESSADASEAESQRPASGDPITGDPITPATLHAYRAGELGAGESERVERALGADPALRRSLAALAGIESPVTPQLRRRVLEPAEARSHRPFWRLAAAAALASFAVAAIYFGVATDRGTGPTAPLVYDVRVEAEAEVRSVAGADRVYPDSQLQLVVEPRDTGRNDVVFALYRLDGKALVRVPETAFELVVHRGAATFAGEAAKLLGDEPGERQLFIVVSNAGDPPAAHLELAEGGGAADALAAGGSRAVMPVTLLMQPPLDTSTPHPGDGALAVAEDARSTERSSAPGSQPAAGATAGTKAENTEGEVP